MPTIDSCIYLLSLKQGAVMVYKTLLFSFLSLPPSPGSFWFLVADSFEKKQHFLQRVFSHEKIQGCCAQDFQSKWHLSSDLNSTVLSKK